MGSWVRVPRGHVPIYKGVWIMGQSAHAPKVPWAHGSMCPRADWSLGPWALGPMAHGPLDQWALGPMGLWALGPFGP